MEAEGERGGVRVFRQGHGGDGVHEQQEIFGEAGSWEVWGFRVSGA